MQNQLKAEEIRFDNQKRRTEDFQTKFNEIQLKYEKATEFLNRANKMLKLKDEEVSMLKIEIKKMNEILKRLGVDSSSESMSI